MKTTRDTFINIEVNGDIIELEIKYNYYAGMRGGRDCFGVPLEPDDEPEVEILSASKEDKEDIWEQLSTDKQDLIIELCLEIEWYRGFHDYDED